MNKWFFGILFMLVDEYVKVLSIFVEIFVDLEFLIVFCIVMVLCLVIGYLEFDRNFSDGIVGGW